MRHPFSLSPVITVIKYNNFLSDSIRRSYAPQLAKDTMQPKHQTMFGTKNFRVYITTNLGKVTSPWHDVALKSETEGNRISGWGLLFDAQAAAVSWPVIASSNGLF